jgi:hypothetical protein
MSRRLVTMALVLLASANIATLIFNLSRPSLAAVAGMDYQVLMADGDVKRAVETIVESCRVNIDLGKARCRGATGD